MNAVLALEAVQGKDMLILTDSLTGCDWIERGLNNNYLVHLIREQMGRLADRNFTIQWIPSHVGIEGNDEADDFAGRGC